MKKIVLATLLSATAVASQAQVAVSGVIGYELNNTGGTTTSGLHDSAIKFTATEKLANGLSVTAEMGVNGFGGRDNAVTSEDATIAVAGAFGEVKAGEIELGNGLLARGLAGAPVIGTDGSVLAGKATNQVISYTSPAVGAFTFNVAAIQSIAGVGDRSYVLGTNYIGGPISAGVDYDDATKRVRTSATYDLKFAKVGAGYSANETAVGDSYVVGVSAPITAKLTVGAAYSNGNGEATEVGASYALSNRTSIAAAYRDIKSTSVVANNTDTVRVRLTHAF